MSTFFLILITLNAQGHDAYRVVSRFPTRAQCEIRMGQLSTHTGYKGAMCVESSKQDFMSDNRRR